MCCLGEAAVPEHGMRSAFASHRVLVTGATGFLGAHVARRLVTAGADVHGTSRSAQSRVPGVRWWTTDLTDRESVGHLIAEIRPAFVYHFGGYVTAAPGPEHVEPTFMSLLASTVWILEALVKVPVERLVLVGSATEASLTGAQPVPSSPYVAAKWAGSAYGRMFHALYGLPLVIARPVMAYGPGQPREKLLPTVIAKMLRGERPKLSSGQLAADWIFVDDVTDGLLACGSARGIDGATIDLGSGTLTSVRELVDRTAKLIRELKGDCVAPDWGVLPDRPSETFVAADVEYAYRRLGWRASIGLEQGLRRTISGMDSERGDGR